MCTIECDAPRSMRAARTLALVFKIAARVSLAILSKVPSWRRVSSPQASSHPLFCIPPAIYTSPPTPSTGHSPLNSITRSATYLLSLRISVLRRFTTGGGGGAAGSGGGEGDSLGSRSPTSEASDPFLHPPTFQVDNSPFSLTQSGINDSPRSIPADVYPHPTTTSNSPSQSPTAPSKKGM
jgi:hypothetical protein